MSRHGTSFPPLRLGSGTPNLSPRSRRRRAPNGAAALPEARLRTFPRTLRRTAAARGREPVEEPRAEKPAESALLPSLPYSPPRSLPPPKNVPLRGELFRPEVTPPSLPPARAPLSPSPSARLSSAPGGRGRAAGPARPNGVRWVWGRGFNPRAVSWLRGAGLSYQLPLRRADLCFGVGRAPYVP